jgi:uncharacterized protein
MTVRYPDSCLVQFAKAPLAGQVKTRLQSTLGKEGCLKLHRALVAYQFRRLQAASVANFELCCSEEHDFFQQLTESTNISVCVQHGECLGERMYNTFVDRLSKYSHVIIIGSDCPFIDANYVSQAFDILKQGVSAVLGPATDGGYVLIGLSCVDGQLFDGVTWGSDQVMEQTRQRLKGLDWQWGELPFLSDIDRPEDLEKLLDFKKF